MLFWGVGNKSLNQADEYINGLVQSTSAATACIQVHIISLGHNYNHPVTADVTCIALHLLPHPKPSKSSLTIWKNFQAANII